MTDNIHAAQARCNCQPHNSLEPPSRLDPAVDFTASAVQDSTAHGPENKTPIPILPVGPAEILDLQQTGAGSLERLAAPAERVCFNGEDAGVAVHARVENLVQRVALSDFTNERQEVCDFQVSHCV